MDLRDPQTHDEEILGAEDVAVVSRDRESERLARVERELRATTAALHDVRGVAIFGSARTAEDHPDYVLARTAAGRLGQEGFPIITGGGPGIMEAANRGARDVGALSVGLNIELPFEQAPNPHQDVELHFSYFFTRKVAFVRHSRAFVVFPGGYGTLDELFEALVLEQVDKIHDFPVVLVGRRFWAGLVVWIQEQLLDGGLISPGHERLFRVVDSPSEIVAAVLHEDG
jgi:uncharacterized protein (TIGR00730 family)